MRRLALADRRRARARRLRFLVPTRRPDNWSRRGRGADQERLPEVLLGQDVGLRSDRRAPERFEVQVGDPGLREQPAREERQRDGLLGEARGREQGEGGLHDQARARRGSPSRPERRCARTARGRSATRASAGSSRCTGPPRRPARRRVPPCELAGCSGSVTRGARPSRPSARSSSSPSSTTRSSASRSPTSRPRSARASPSLQWIVDGYMLAFAALMLTGGTLGDLFGRKKVMLGGVAIFCGGSVMAALAHRDRHPHRGPLVMGVGRGGVGAGHAVAASGTSTRSGRSARVRSACGPPSRGSRSRSVR